MAPSTYGTLRETSASRAGPRRALAIMPRAAAIGGACALLAVAAFASPRGAAPATTRLAAPAPLGLWRPMAPAPTATPTATAAPTSATAAAPSPAPTGAPSAGATDASANASSASSTTPAPTTATPAPTSSPSILLYKRTHATADAEADAVFLRDNFGLNITINETAVKDEGTLDRTGGDLCAKRFGHTTLPTYSIHLFESAVTPQGPVPVADWVAYWRALHHGFVRADALVGGVAEPNANYTAERADAWDAFMYNSQTFYAPDLTPFVRRLRANGVPMFPATYNASLNPSDLSPVRRKPRQPLAETERGVDARSPAPPPPPAPCLRARCRARARARRCACTRSRSSCRTRATSSRSCPSTCRRTSRAGSRRSRRPRARTRSRSRSRSSRCATCGRRRAARWAGSSACPTCSS